MDLDFFKPGESLRYPQYGILASGPFYKLTTWLRLCDPDFGRLGRRIVAAVALLWLPVLVLSMIDGRAWQGARVPLLSDIDTMLRYLVAMPLLFTAEQLLHRKLAIMLDGFPSRGLVDPAQEASFEAVVESTRRRLSSPAVEVSLLAFVYLVGVGIIWREVSMLELDTWYGRVVNGALTLHLAGYWMQWVSVPLLLFLILRWYYRLAALALLTFRLSRLDLRLQPLHPDHLGGLGFLSSYTSAFVPLLAAQGTMASGWIAGQIAHNGASMLDFRLELALAAAISLALVLAPLLAFSPGLSEAKRARVAVYGVLAIRYVAEFEQRALSPNVQRDSEPLGDADVQSLADFNSVYAALSGMRLVPFSGRALVVLAAAFLLPAVPLAFTLMSTEEIFTRVVDLLL